MKRLRLLKDHLDFTLILQLTCFAVFFGRAWQHLFWDAPFRTILWDERLMGPIVQSVLNMAWDHFVTHPNSDFIIQWFIRFTGGFYLVCALVSLLPPDKMKKFGGFLLAGSISLALLALMYCKEQFLYLGQFVEYAAQFGAPFMLYLIVDQKIAPEKILRLLQIAVAFTFAGHGLYAVGYYPVPGAFIDMTIAILGVSEAQAIQFLMVAGILDFAIAIAIFWPKVALPFSIYAVFWGLATAMARLFANYDHQIPIASLNQWLPEVLYRLPHAGVPLALSLVLFAQLASENVLNQSPVPKSQEVGCPV